MPFSAIRLQFWKKILAVLLGIGTLLPVSSCQVGPSPVAGPGKSATELPPLTGSALPLPMTALPRKATSTTQPATSPSPTLQPHFVTSPPVAACIENPGKCPFLLYFREMLENPTYEQMLALTPPPELADLHYELVDRKASLEEIDAKIAGVSAGENNAARLGFVQARSTAEKAYLETRERAMAAWRRSIEPYGVHLPESFPELYPFTDIAFVDPMDGWITGRKGMLLHYDGETWQRASSPTQADLYGLALPARGDGWAWGAAGQDGRSVLLRLNGDRWQRVENPAHLPEIRFIDALSPTLVWMLVGAPKSDELEILRFNGVGWRLEKSTRFSNAVALQMHSRQAGWVEGFSHNKILVHIGESWRNYTLASPENCSINQVSLLSPENGWAVGEKGCLFQFDGHHWAQKKSPTTGNLRRLVLLDSQLGWAAGQNGILLRFNGKEWEKESSPGRGDFEVLLSFRRDLAFAMTSAGEVLRYNGTEWQREDFPVGLGFSAMTALLPNDELWAITPLQGLVHYKNGAWEVVSEWPDRLP